MGQNASYDTVHPTGAIRSRWSTTGFGRISCADCHCVYRVARKLAITRIVLPVLLLFQPWFAASSVMAVTEVPFSLIMILVVYLALQDRYLVTSAAVGLLPLVRHEGILMVFLWAIFMVLQKNRRAAVLAFIPYATYTVGLELADFASPLDLLMDAGPSNLYGAGGWMHFSA